MKFNHDLDIFFDDAELPDRTMTSMEQAHGKMIGRMADAYHDITIYEDGTEESYYLGD